MVPGFILFLVANILNNVLFGLYVSMVAECFRVTIQKYRNTGKVNKVLLTCFVLITLLATTKIVVDNVLTVRAFAFPTPDGQPQYEPITSPLAFAVNALWLIQTIVADSFVVYRVWILWSPNYLVGVVPVLLLLACIGITGYDFWVFLDWAGLQTLNDTLKAFLALTLALNLICTGLIAYRVWSIRRRIQSIPVPSGMGAPKVGRKDPVKNAVAIIVESALIYTIFLTIDLVLFATGSIYSFVVTPLLPQVIALVFGSVIIRSSQGHGVENTTFGTHNVPQTMPLFASNHSCPSTHIDNVPVVLERTSTSQVDDDDRSNSVNNPVKG